MQSHRLRYPTPANGIGSLRRRKEIGSILPKSDLFQQRSNNALAVRPPATVLYPPGRALQHEVAAHQGDRAGELDVEVGHAVAVDVAGDGRHAGAGDGEAQLTGVMGEEARADEGEGLVA